MRSFVGIGCVTLLLGACGQSQPPRGPAHTPANTPEPPTTCKSERAAAKSGREISLDDPSVAARRSTASAVLAHLECELAQLDAQQIPQGSQDAIMAEIRIFRDQFQTAQTLADEVRRYEDALMIVGGWLRLGDLNRLYASKLRAAPAPVDLRPNQREAFRAELVDIAIDLEKQAALAYVGAVDASDAARDGPDEKLESWISEACAGLKKLDPDASRRRVVCGGR